MMEEYGDVRDVYIPQDYHTRRPRYSFEMTQFLGTTYYPTIHNSIQRCWSYNSCVFEYFYGRGFAFVEFYSADDAAEAHDKLDHAKLAGREIAIVFAKDKRKTPGEMRGGRDVGPRGNGQLRVLMRLDTDWNLRRQ